MKQNLIVVGDAFNVADGKICKYFVNQRLSLSSNTYHFRTPVRENNQKKELKGHLSTLVDELGMIEGVEEFYIDQYSVQVNISMAFTWADVEKEILQAIGKASFGGGTYTVTNEPAREPSIPNSPERVNQFLRILNWCRK